MYWLAYGSYNSDNIRKQFDSFIQAVQSCFEQNFKVSSIKQFGPFLQRQADESLIEDI